MLTRDSGIDNGKFSNKLSRNKKSKSISQAINAEDKDSCHKKILLLTPALKNVVLMGKTLTPGRIGLRLKYK